MHIDVFVLFAIGLLLGAGLTLFVRKFEPGKRRRILLILGGAFAAYNLILVAIYW